MTADQLKSEAEKAILKLEGVFDSGRGSYRIGSKVFVRLGTDPEVLTYGFKLPADDFSSFVQKYKCIEPMQFGGMGKKGWVELSLTRRNQIPLLMRALRKSHELF